MAAAPTVWALRLIVNMAIASSSCLPGIPVAGAQNHRLHEPTMLAVDVVALMIALAAAGLAYRDWRRTRAEKPGSSDHALEVGEGRARFLALAGIIVSLGFALATLFDLAALSIVPLCTR